MPKPSLRWAWGMTMVMVAGGCGVRTTIEDCGPAGAIPSHRPGAPVPCGHDEAPGLLAIETAEQWHEHCGKVEPVDFSREMLLGYFLEGGCAYSGCTGGRHPSSPG